MYERTTIHYHLLIWPAVLAATGARKLAALSVLCCVGVTLPAAPPTICAQSSGEAQTVIIPMRDGVELSTALQFPESGRAPFPVVLLRTAYGKRSQRGYGHFFSQNGYVVAIQDVRGANASQGEFQIWQHEKEDGYDTVKWLAAQEWSNGKVGMIGGSYGGWVQLAAAAVHASSSAKDTDWVVYWRVIDDQDNPVPMGRGTLRARFRNSPARPELLAEHQIYEYTLDLWHMGMLIEPGWRIRVEVASACFPAFSRNLNTGGSNEWDTEYVTAEQRIFHSQRYPSHLVLSVIDSIPLR
jgi:predicted acyl esterase